ncbi:MULTISPECIES: hypothetical protein [Virgibacillus]|uniref:Uncharacterized protein n=1 Tax=Virgibacillus kapii TaxID=1638645 RepID=A0ABQ2DCH3_9BACI|nr:MULTISPECIES: hypothetical protein [Virgibacillus]EQB38280.1 hypothetical protein M948_06790 [Virgibacillus sp. CM-4]MYL40985.1 hypothetical protein [Virgibacillus massiliensis]GGJ53343.1 hypothetical protein GCM10007111_14450 [Virgibacillus kapii]
MGKKVIYFLFTDTGTNLSKAINYFTKQSLNHVSIGFDEALTEVYSFGRKRPKNPFIGGFVEEDIRSDFLRDANCAIYRFTISETECEKIIENIKLIKSQKHKYRYNFIGLLGILLQIEINRKCALFCSQFVATVLKDVPSFKPNKPTCFVTPADIRDHTGMELVYEGLLKNYPAVEQVSEQGVHSMKQQKQSFLFIISSKVKQFVIR